MQVVYRESPGGRVFFFFLKNPGPDARRARTVLSRKKNSPPGDSLYTTKINPKKCATVETKTKVH